MLVCGSNFVGYSGSGETLMRLDRKSIMGRLSGHSDTSIGNSIVMAVTTCQVISEARYVLDIPMWEALYAKYGFKMKLKVGENVTDVTFLKGLWYECTTGLYWGPLPSRILKCGKSLKDPRMLYKETCLSAASTKFLGDVAKGYSYFIRIPILRAFVDNFSKYATGKRLVDLDERMLYKYSANTQDVKPLITSVENICRRYDTTPEEIEELERMYPDQPFHFIQHPLLEKLASDYA